MLRLPARGPVPLSANKKSHELQGVRITTMDTPENLRGFSVTCSCQDLWEVISFTSLYLHFLICKMGMPVVPAAGEQLGMGPNEVRP